MISAIKGLFDFSPASEADFSCEAFSTLVPSPPQSLANFYLVLHWNDGGDRPEQLLVVRRHTLLDIGKNSRRIERAIALRELTAKQALRPFLNTLPHLIVKFVSQIMPGLRAHRGLFLQGIAHLLGTHSLHEEFLKSLPQRSTTTNRFAAMQL